jgi:UTP--glucose-1-phosphate uridylyltransferase
MRHPITTAVIAAAGQATRMWPASKVCPKELFPLGRIPVIVHLVWEMMDCGISDIVVVAAAHNRHQLEALFDASQPAPVKVATDPLVRRFEESLQRVNLSIIEQTGRYGNGSPLRDAVERLGLRSCLYAFGDDVIIGENASCALIDLHARTGHAVMGAQDVAPSKQAQFGILETVRRGDVDYVTRIVEKPKPHETTSTLASFGRYLMTPAIIEMLARIGPGRDGEVWLVDAINAHLETGGQVCVYPLPRGKWYTVGDPQSYADAVQAATEHWRRAT